MNPASNLFLIGPTGAGKTTLGQRLAPHYGLRFVDLDREIEQRAGADIPAIFQNAGETGFRRHECAVLDACSRADGVLMAVGAGAVLDAGNRRLLRERGFVVWLKAGIDEQLARLVRDHHRPLLDVADRAMRLREMAQTRDPLYRELAELAIEDTAAEWPDRGAHAVALIDRHWRRPSPVAVRTGA